LKWYKECPRLGTIRTKTSFLFLPKTIDGVTKWLEKAIWEECFILTSHIPIFKSSEKPVWVPIKWKE